MKNYTVGVFDDRVPIFAKRNVKVEIKTPTLTPKIMIILVVQFALKQVYETPAEREKHCTRVQVYAANQDGFVIDGDVFTTVDFKNSDDELYKELRARLIEETTPTKEQKK